MVHTVDLRKRVNPERSREGSQHAPASYGINKIQDPEKIEKKEINKIEWVAHQNKMSHHSPYLLTSGLIVAGIVLALLYNILFGIILILSGLVLILLSRRPVPPPQVRIDTAGVQIDTRRYLYPELHSFSITYLPGGKKELSLRTNQRLGQYIRLSLGQANPIDVRTRLITYLPEQKHEPSLVEAVMEKFGF